MSRSRAHPGYGRAVSGERVLSPWKAGDQQHLRPQSGGAVAALFGAARDAGAGLVVMGGYGHSRLRELVFGGFTARVLIGFRTK